MTTFYDASIGIATESTYKTFATPTRWYEFTDESLDWSKNVKQGKGLRVGSRVARSGRRVVPTAEGGGDFSLEVVSKGMGLLWQAALGSGVSTQIAATTAYQQNFTLGDTPASLTVQKGIPEVGGTVDPHTFLGGMVTNFEINSPNDDIVTAKFGFDFGDITTAQSYVAPSYTASPVNLFHFGQGAVSLGGTLTAPTTTTLASSTGPSSVSVRNFSLSVTNPLEDKRYTYGGAGRKSKPVLNGVREIKGKFTAEYDQTVTRDAFLNETSVPLIITFTGPLITGSHFETFQVVLPEVKIDSDLPNANGGQFITIDHSFSVLDNLVSAQPLWLIHKTTDTAL